MLETTDTKEQELARFTALLLNQYQQVAEQDPLRKVRTKAWELFTKVGLPTKKNEVFRYIRLNQLFAHPYEASPSSKLNQEAIAAYIYPECQHSVLVFVNGRYTPSLSNLKGLSERISISSLDEASKTYGAFLNNQWAKTFKDESDPFAVLNAALHQEGTFIYVAPKTVVEAPLQILNIIDAKTQTLLIMPRIHLFVGAQSQLNTVTSTGQLSGTRYAMNQVVDIHLEEGAILHHTQSSSNQPHEAWHLDALRAHLKRNSCLTTVNATTGSSTIRNDYRVSLAGENAEVHLNGVWMLKDKREAHTNVLIEHLAPHCRSNQFFKGVLSDFSRSSFEGKIFVDQIAQKTEAFQLNNNLILSDRAHADSKPNLEIFADDVKASHGATIGQLDADQLFYMRTRGISAEEAKALLVFSYCQEILEMIKLPSLRQQLLAQQ